ncbi:MAG: YceI family protein [Crocinitomicaceae bacterium]|nr:YceI family protein [Crocinitomicaceae bacterium]
MKKVLLMGIAAFSMFIASCGGGSAEGTGTDTTAVDTTPAVVINEYTVDTAASIVTWKAYGKIGDTSKYHMGTLKMMGGTISASDSAGTSTLTAATIDFDMNSAKESAGAVDLDGHLKSPDFFDIAQFATSSFAFESFDGTNATGTLSIIGKTVSITAPTTIAITPENVTVEVSMFLVDFLAMEMPYFVEDAKQKPEKQHDPKIEVTVSIVATK